MQKNHRNCTKTFQLWEIQPTIFVGVVTCLGSGHWLYIPITAEAVHFLTFRPSLLIFIYQLFACLHRWFISLRSDPNVTKLLSAHFKGKTIYIQQKVFHLRSIPLSSFRFECRKLDHMISNISVEMEGTFYISYSENRTWKIEWKRFDVETEVSSISWNWMVSTQRFQLLVGR